MATKKKAVAPEAGPERPAQPLILEPQTGGPSIPDLVRNVKTPEQVWDEVLELGRKLGIDTKMAIDLLQLTAQRNSITMSMPLEGLGELITGMPSFEASAPIRPEDGL